ncbi:MAG: hypothetical protein OEW24_00890 [Chloroflexota bacterium]|nr:hypothetical protein [Chloroflexota bacterium]
MTTDAGFIRPARLADRQALAALSRRVHLSEESHRRSLGVPTPPETLTRISLADLVRSWLPLRSPSVHLVAELDGKLVGSCRAIEEPHRDDWVITELDAADAPMAAEVRFALLQAVVEEGTKHNVARFHAACSDAPENLTLFQQIGFAAYAAEEIFYRPPDGERGGRSWLRTILPSGTPGAASGGSAQPSLQAIGPADAWHLFDLWTHATPPAVARTEDYSAADWEPVGHEGVVPRSSLNPLLHFSSVNAWAVHEGQRLSAFAQHGASREGPHYLRFLIRDGADGGGFLNAVLSALGGEAAAAGIIAPARTYESAGLAAADSAGFEPIGEVTMLVREVRAPVRQPAMVPAI